MDRSSPQVAQFAATLAAMDDDALASLANKGLVRRARKDMEKSPPSISSADGQSVMLQIEGFDIRLVQPVNQSTCSCASGICRHILASVIFVREATPASPPTESKAAADTVGEQGLAEAFLAIDDGAIEKWATKPLMKRAVVALSRGYEVEQTPAAVLVRLPGQNIAVRWIGGGLDRMICACHAPGACEHKVAAVLAFRAHKTGKPIELPQAALQASSGAPRSREEIRQSVRTLLCEMVAAGLTRVSESTHQRLRTLATSAHGVDLPRLERMLRGLADEVLMTVKRDAAASSASLLHSGARIAALCEALERPTPAIVGEHRSVYMPVAGSIELLGLGASRWRTRSGYHGLTVYFWEPSAKRWTGWTDARPLGTPGFDPVNRLDESGPWSGAATPRQAARTAWRLSGTFRNGVGRITSRDNTRGIPGKPSNPMEGPILKDWAQLASIAEQAFAPGLADRRDHVDLAMLAPARWEDAVYDPIRQEVTRPIVDEAGRTIPLILRHSEETSEALTTLQELDSATARAVLGFIRIGPAGLFLEPMTIWTDAKPIHLTLDGAVAKPAPVAAADPDDLEEPESDADQVPVVDQVSAIGGLLARIEGHLLSIAESGVHVVRDTSELRSASTNLRAVGMTGCAEAIDRLCVEVDRFRRSMDRDDSLPADALLRCAYLVRLAAECQTVCEVVGA